MCCCTIVGSVRFSSFATFFLAVMSTSDFNLCEPEDFSTEAGEAGNEIPMDVDRSAAAENESIIVVPAFFPQSALALLMAMVSHQHLHCRMALLMLWVHHQVIGRRLGKHHQLGLLVQCRPRCRPQ